jgi:hypothetical protein
MDPLTLVEEYYHAGPGQRMQEDASESSEDAAGDICPDREKAGLSCEPPPERSSMESMSFDVINAPSAATVTAECAEAPSYPDFVNLSDLPDISEKVVSSRGCSLRTTGFDSEADDEDEEVSAQQQCTSEPRGAVQRHLSEPPAPPSQLDRNVPSNCHQDVAWIVVNGYPIPAPEWFQDVLAQNQRLFDSLLVACRFARPRIDASQSLPNNNERYHLDVARRTCSNKNVAFDFRVYNFDAVCMPYNVDVPDFFKMVRMIKEYYQTM